MGPPKEQTVAGWGVVRRSPWHLAAVFLRRDHAEACAKELGPGYEAHFGERRAGSDEFVWTTKPQDGN